MTKTITDWEQEFSRRITCDDDDVCFFPYGGDSNDFDSGNCKSFIRQLLTQTAEEARKEGAKEIVPKIRGIFITYPEEVQDEISVVLANFLNPLT